MRPAYTFPSQQYLEGRVNQTPDDFVFGLKVTDTITINKFPKLDRFGQQGVDCGGKGGGAEAQNVRVRQQSTGSQCAPDNCCHDRRCESGRLTARSSAMVNTNALIASLFWRAVGVGHLQAFETRLRIGHTAAVLRGIHKPPCPTQPAPYHTAMNRACLTVLASLTALAHL